MNWLFQNSIIFGVVVMGLVESIVGHLALLGDWAIVNMQRVIQHYHKS